MGVPVVMGLKKQIHIRISMQNNFVLLLNIRHWSIKLKLCLPASLYVSVITVTHLATIDHLVTYVVCKCTIK